jgi:hypothetical protein
MEEFARDGTVPKLLTKAEYMRRGKRWEESEARCNAKTITKAKLEQVKFDTRNVCGVSQLTRLPYFDIVKQSLYDMMHLTAGLVGRNCIELMKGTRGTGGRRPNKAPPAPGISPGLPRAWPAHTPIPPKINKEIKAQANYI